MAMNMPVDVFAEKEGIDAIPVEELEAAIIQIGAGMEKLNSSRLTRRAIVVLLQDSSKQSRRNIECVLNALDQLESRYLKAKKPDLP
jgi:hypothetical protein